MYEDMEPLFANPVLPLLAIALADRAFQDDATFEELEAIPPPADGSLHHLRIKKDMLRVPFFQIVSADGPTGKIHGSGLFSNRMVALGHRAGYEENIGIHDIRREALVKADDNGYSTSERMKFAGHNNSDTFFGSYAPELSGVDGRASYWSKKRRTIHLEGFRGLSLHHHPQLLQSLPAKVEADLDNRSDFVSINKEIEMLGEKVRGFTTEVGVQPARARREELYWRKRQIVSEELFASLSSYFNRIRRLDPPRDRLASLLFLNVPLRSAQGRSALQDMITLCKENPRVAYRPSLRPANGRCPVPQCARDMDRFVYLFCLISQMLGGCGLADQNIFQFYRINIGDRWEHIYRCHKGDLERKYDFAELCFQCDEWITSGIGWFEHCQRHLTDLETLPVQCNPLVFRRTLATAGQCLFCLFDLKLSPTKRFHQFLVKQSWKKHLQEHFWHFEDRYNRSIETGECKVVPCPDPRCALSFDSIQDLQCHCQDVHCVERIKLDPIKRSRLTRQSSLNVRAFASANVKLEHRCDLLNGQSSYKHINKTIDSPILEPLDVIIRTGPVRLEDSNSLNQSYSLPLTDSVANQEKRSSSAAFTGSESPLSSIDWTSDEAALDDTTPAASSVISDLPLSIDPRLLNESISQPAIPPL
ncbi:MAG: hypothetical protein Q9216_005048 [Gyalolechia sp. 2 TL-2023]